MLMQADAMPMRVDAMPMQVDAMPMQVDAMPMQADAMPMRVDAMPMRPDAMRLCPNTMLMQADAFKNARLLHKSLLSTVLHKFVAFFNAKERGGKRKVTQSFCYKFSS